MSTLAPTSVVPLYAGFWRRGAALLIDSLVLIVPNVAVTLALSGVWSRFLAQLVVTALYTTLMHASARQATLGKIAFGIKVTDNAGQRIGYGRALSRYFAAWLSVLTLGIGYILAALTARREALHDMLCRTYVVNAKASAGDIGAGGDTMPITAGVAVTAALLLGLPFFGGILAAIAIPAYQDYMVRARMAQVFAASMPIRRQIEEAYVDKRPWQAGPVPIASAYAKGAIITAEGDVVVELADNLVQDGRVRFDPWAVDDRIRGWNCHGEHVPPKWLPPSCRN
jgi:uncharacterized RDD family membrane protein YckC